MSITLKAITKEKENLYGEIRQNKHESSYEVLIDYYGRTIYRKHFATMANAEKALKRNIEKY